MTLLTRLIDGQASNYREYKAMREDPEGLEELLEVFSTVSLSSPAPTKNNKIHK